MSGPVLIDSKISFTKINELAQEFFGDMVKIVVDLRGGVMTAGGELHADGEKVLLEQGSSQEDLWGANYFPGKPNGEKLEYTAMINIRPKQQNRSQRVESEDRRKKIQSIVELLFGAA